MSFIKDAKEVMDKQSKMREQNRKTKTSLLKLDIELYNKFQRLLLLKDHYIGSNERTPPRLEQGAEKRSYSVSGKKNNKGLETSAARNKKREKEEDKTMKERGNSANKRKKTSQHNIKEKSGGKGEVSSGIVKKAYIKERSFKSDLVLKPPKNCVKGAEESEIKMNEIAETTPEPEIQMESSLSQLKADEKLKENYEEAVQPEEEEKFAIIERGRKNYRIEPILNERKKKKSVGKQEASANKNQHNAPTRELGRNFSGETNDDKALEDFIRKKYAQQEFDEQDFENVKDKLNCFNKILNHKTFLVLKNLIKPSEQVQIICKGLLLLFAEQLGLDLKAISEWKGMQPILESEKLLACIQDFCELVDKGQMSETRIMSCAITLEKFNVAKANSNNEASFLISITSNLYEFLSSACDYFFTHNSLKDSKHQNFLLTQKLPTPYPSEIQAYRLEREDECDTHGDGSSRSSKDRFRQADQNKIYKNENSSSSSSDRWNRGREASKGSRKSSTSSGIDDRRSSSSRKIAMHRESSGKLSKLDRIMKLKVEKPEKESVVKKYVDESISAKDLKKTKLCSDETLLIQEEIDKTNKEMKEMEGKKQKLLSIYERERKHQQRLEEMKKSKQEIEEEFQKNRKLEEIHSSKEKEERYFLKEIKQNNIEDMRRRKKNLNEQQKEREDEDLANSKNDSIWKDVVKKAEIKTKKQTEKDLNESIISLKQAVQKQREEQKLKEMDDINRRKEDSLKFKQKEAMTKKEELEKQLEKTLDFINSLRMSKLN